MKKYVLFLLIISINTAFSQKTNNLGFFAGGSYYLGELNQNKQFYKLQPSLGLSFRHNYNPRWATRVNLYGGNLAANDLDSKNLYQTQRAFSFNTMFIDLAGQMELNFLPYRLGEKKTPFTPYTAVGLGGAYLTNSIKPIQITIPISLGIKFNITEKIGLGLEWSFRKTFTDYIDNISNYKTIEPSSDIENKYSYKQIGYYHHADWYSFVGVFVNWKAFNGKSNCKAYIY
jgi:hypothetical protein